MRKSWPVMPKLPEYGPWHEYVAGRVVMPLSSQGAPLLADAPADYLDSYEIAIEGIDNGNADRVIAVGASPCLHDFDVERIVCPEPFGIWRVAVDGYLVRGELRDPQVDYAHAGDLGGRKFRVFDIVPYTCRRDAWIVVAFSQPIGFNLEHAVVFGRAVERVALGGKSAPATKETGTAS